MGGIVQALFFDNAAVTPSPNLASTATALASSLNPAMPSNQVTFTASVIGSGAIPAGTVTFFDGANNLGAGTLSGAAVATLTTSNLAASVVAHSITAAYNGNSYFAGSTSQVVSQVVNFNTNSLADVTNGLMARWPFSEGAGTTTADASGHGNTGALMNSPQWTNGLGGRSALAFLGYLYPNISFVLAPASATLPDQGLGSNLTICAWVQRSMASIGNYAAVVSKDITNDASPYHRNYEMIFDTSSHLLFIYRNSTGSSWEIYTSSGTYTDTNNWHFYGISYTYGNAASCALYVDGQAITGSWTTGDGSDAPAVTSGGPVLIGADGTGTASDGSIYNYISIYNTILTPTQINTIYALEASASSSVSPSGPQLSIALAGTNVTLQWPSGYSGWTLQYATNPAATNWGPVPGAISNQVTVPITNRQQYFRLQGGN